MAEKAFGIPMSHCALAVSRGPQYKYVQFAGRRRVCSRRCSSTCSRDPDQTHNLLVEDGAAVAELAWEATRELLQWQMRTAERTLSGSFLDPETRTRRSPRHLAVRSRRPPDRP